MAEAKSDCSLWMLALKAYAATKAASARFVMFWAVRASTFCQPSPSMSSCIRQ